MNDRAREDWSLPRAVFRLIVALIVGTALVFATAPFFAFRAMKAAARDGDGHGLAQLVDYPAVRQGLRPQVAARAAPAPATPKAKPKNSPEISPIRFGTRFCA